MIGPLYLFFYSSLIMSPPYLEANKQGSFNIWKVFDLNVVTVEIICFRKSSNMCNNQNFIFL